MPRETETSLIRHTNGYFSRLPIHAIMYVALVVVRSAIRNPVSLHSPLVLFVSLVSLLTIFTIQIRNFNAAMSIHTFNHKATSSTYSDKSRYLSLFNGLKSFLMFGSNLSVALFSILFMVYTNTSMNALIGGLLIFHALYCIRDYLSDQHALSFVNQYFRITTDRKDPEATDPIDDFVIRPRDPSSYHMIAQNIDNSVADTYAMRCQLHQIPAATIDPNAANFQIMCQPILLTHRDTEQTYWVEKMNLLSNNNVFNLSDYDITHEHDPRCQEKIKQARSIIIATFDNLNHLKTIHQSLSTTCNEDVFQSYRQAIGATLDEPIADNVTTKPLPGMSDHFIIKQLNDQRSELISHFTTHNIAMTDLSPPSLSTEPKLCDITAQTPIIPLQVNIHDRKTRALLHTFYCDAKSLIGWLDSDPGDSFDDSIEQSLDYDALQSVINRPDRPVPMIVKHQILDLQSRLVSAAAANPIALLLKYHGKDCAQTLDLLLSNAFLRCRLHDRDLLTTLSADDQRYFSLSHYLRENSLDEYTALIVTKCYAVDTSSESRYYGLAASTNSETSLLSKRWPIHRLLMVSPDTTLDIKLDLNTLNQQHDRAIRVIQHVLTPRVTQLKEKMHAEENYYVRSDHGFGYLVGSEITPERLLHYSLYAERTTISTQPLDRESFANGILLKQGDTDAIDRQNTIPTRRQLFPNSPV